MAQSWTGEVARRRAKAVELRKRVVLPEPIGGAVFVPLTRGQYAIVDEDDIEKVKPYLWAAWWNKTAKSYYAVAHAMSEGGKRTKIYMHRLILKPKPGFITDHIESEQTLDNRKLNLRYATKVTNGQNSAMRSDNTSGYKGVTWDKQASKWKSSLRHDGKRLHLGLFSSKEAAYAAYCAGAAKFYGEFAKVA